MSNGKGGTYRPYNVQHYCDNYDVIFGHDGTMSFANRSDTGKTVANRYPRCHTCGVNTYATCASCDGVSKWRAK